MTQTHKVATDALDTLGKCPIPDNSGRDAIHLAVEPVIAGQMLIPGERIQIINGQAFQAGADATGIVDPFITGAIEPGERFWFVVLPRTITSLRHVWSHPLFPDQPVSAYHADADDHYVTPPVVISEVWMRAWAVEHLGEDYYGGEGDKVDPEGAYQFALEVGHTHNIGPYESARDYIDNVWWDHWERITGEKGDREEYFSCAC